LTPNQGYPDISAIGDNVVIYNKGAPTLIGGTSASSPVWGAILTRINLERLKAGKSTVGFVNPTLYAHPEVLHDITTGSNPGCGEAGFTCSKGWDPVTGLGRSIAPFGFSSILMLTRHAELPCSAQAIQKSLIMWMIVSRQVEHVWKR